MSRIRMLLACSALALVAVMLPEVPAGATAPGANGPIAFSSNRTGNNEIFTVDPGGGGITNITNHPAQDFRPAISPDGTRVAFTSDRDGDSEIYVMNLSGGGLQKLTDNGAPDDYAAWSPDGARIAFTSRRTGDDEIFVMNADGSGQANLTNHPGPDYAPDFSPDGTRIAFDSGRTGNYDVYVMDVRGGGQTNLTAHPASDGSPSWSPDGTRIAFDSSRAGDQDIWTMNPDGSGLQCVTQSTANDDGPSWSPDGALIAFRSDRDGNTEIYRMPATIGATLRLTNSSGADADPSWGPRPLDPAVRLWGADRYLTAVAVSGNTFGPGAASAVVLARGDLFPDALAGTPLAYQRNAPILLTPTAQLAAVTRGELLRVLPVGSTVFLLGGTAALSTNVEQQVQSLGYTTVRLGGATRYGTAALIAQRLGSPAPLYLATGQSFQAALVSGVAAAHTGGAVVLTEGNRIPGESQDYLDTRGGVPRIAVGPEAIQADPTAAPVGGSNQYEVARNLANQVFGPSPQHAALASGTVFADGLTGGPHIARRGGPLLLTDPVSLSSPTGEYLLNHAPPVDTLWVYGGSAAISHGAVMDARRAISGVS